VRFRTKLTLLHNQQESCNKIQWIVELQIHRIGDPPSQIPGLPKSSLLANLAQRRSLQVLKINALLLRSESLGPAVSIPQLYVDVDLGTSLQLEAQSRCPRANFALLVLPNPQ